MVNERYSKAMAETLHYLKGINENDIKKIPNKFMQFLKENALQNYECDFDYNKPLKELKLLEETRGLISMICLNYWCETEEEKDEFIKHLNENEKRYQEKLRKKYEVYEIFKKKEIVEKINKNILLIESEKLNILKKILKFVLNLFHTNNKKLERDRMRRKNTFELIINYELIDEFCKLNNMLVVTDKMLQENNMFKNIVYATNNNFVGRSVYPKDMPIIMNQNIWEKLIKINNELKEKNFCIKIYDAYRPIGIQKLFWEFFYEENGYYDEHLVANPNKYGTHNITINAVDICLCNLDGINVELPCEFDDFTGKANIFYNECSNEAKNNRDLLINIAQKHGLIVNQDEWWHFYDEELKDYGMGFNFLESDFIPQKDTDVFVLVVK